MAFTNGTFETGDLTGWIPTGDGGYDTEEASAAAKLFGSYGGHLLIEDFGTDPAWAQIDQEIGAVAAGSFIQFWYRINASDVGGDGMLSIAMYEDEEPEISEYIVLDNSPDAGGWVQKIHKAAWTYINAHIEIFVLFDPGT